MGHFRALFFIFVFTTVNSEHIFISSMTGFEPRTSVSEATTRSTEPQLPSSFFALNLIFSDSILSHKNYKNTKIAIYFSKDIPNVNNGSFKVINYNCRVSKQ